jgi:lipopolysaccharide export system protein LptC
MVIRPFTLDSLRFYTRFVHISKFTLSLMVILILVFLVVIPLIAKQNSGVRVAFVSTEQKEDTLPVMVNPRYQGVDNKNQPYLVTADSAMQTDENTVTLEKVKADITTNDNAWLALLADQGTLNMAEQSLLLQGGVQFYHDNGAEMRTEQLRLDLNNRSAYGESPVIIQGDFGHIHSNRFAIVDKGNRVLFNDRVNVLLLP